MLSLIPVRALSPPTCIFHNGATRGTNRNNTTIMGIACKVIIAARLPCTQPLARVSLWLIPTRQVVRTIMHSST